MFGRLAPLAALVALLVTVGGASAQTPVTDPSFTIVPEPGEDPAVTKRGYFVYELAPGAEADGTVRLENPSSAPVTVELAAVDATTARGGGGSYVAADAVPSGAGAWLRLSARRVTLEPGEQASVGFTLRLPETVDSGQYLAGIVAYVPVGAATPAVPPGANEAGAAVIVQPRSVISVQFNVPGDWTSSLAITGAGVLATASGTQLAIGLRNDGDTFLRPEGSFTLTNAAATPVASEPISLGLFLPSTDLTHAVSWPEAPAPGNYGVAVELRYGDDQIARYSGTVTVDETAPAVPATPEEAAPPATPALAPEAPAPAQPWPLPAVAAVLALIVVLLAVVLFQVNRRRTRG